MGWIRDLGSGKKLFLDPKSRTGSGSATLHLSHVARDALVGFPEHRHGLAWLSLARLDLSVDPKSQISSTCKSV
jgi:hypothetical protein